MTESDDGDEEELRRTIPTNASAGATEGGSEGDFPSRIARSDVEETDDKRERGDGEVGMRGEGRRRGEDKERELEDKERVGV